MSYADTRRTKKASRSR